MKITKILLVLIMLIFVLSFANNVYADADVPEYSITETGKEWLEIGSNRNSI